MSPVSPARSATPFPISISKVSLKHDGETKAYHVTTACNARGQGITIFRWGRIGREGQVLVEKHHSSSATAQAALARIKQKQRRGYEESAAKEHTATTEAELKQFIGPSIWFKIGADAISHLAPGASTAGVTTPEPEAVWEIDPKTGEHVNINARKPRGIPEPAPVEPTIADKIAADPLFGEWG